MKNEVLDSKLSALAKTLLKLRTVDEIKSFLEDLLTKSEQVSITSRLHIAEMLDNGVSYSQIQRETGASSATIAKVSDNLKYGNDGFKTAIERLGKTK
jgi:TrpR-related protein YerC/YecD